jgi:hypothetical protein
MIIKLILTFSKTKHLTCSGKDKATVVHSEKVDEESISFMWKYPDTTENEMEVMFYYSVVAGFDKFWVKLKSEKLTIMPGTKFTEV